MIGEATGRSERADELNQEFDDAIAATKEKVADTVAALPTDRASCTWTAGWSPATSPSVRTPPAR